MEAWDALRARRNVRQYRTDPIPADALDRILKQAGALRQRPTGSIGTSWW